jgi:hypothetical protein
MRFIGNSLNFSHKYNDLLWYTFLPIVSTCYTNWVFDLFEEVVYKCVI